MAQINSSGQSVPHACVICAPTIEHALSEALNKMEAATRCEELDATAITEADCVFHNVIISLTKNPQLVTLSEYINRITVPSRVSPRYRRSLSCH